MASQAVINGGLYILGIFFFVSRFEPAFELKFILFYIIKMFLFISIIDNTQLKV